MQRIAGAVIAAAGMGTRIGLGMPKCMIEVEGKTLLTRLIETLRPHVPAISVVVGYREEMVTEYCARHHRDVVLVRNRDYRTTNTAYSYALGAAPLGGKVLYLDGDLVLMPHSIAEFVRAAAQTNILVGVAEAKTENAVFVQGVQCGRRHSIVNFSRTEQGAYEWANVLSGPADLLDGATGFVFERLSEHLPLDAKVLELAEVDTESDLAEVQRFVRKLTLTPAHDPAQRRSDLRKAG